MKTKIKITLSYGLPNLGSVDKKYRVTKINGDISIFAKGQEFHIDELLDEEHARSLIGCKSYDVTVRPSGATASDVVVR